MSQHEYGLVSQFDSESSMWVFMGQEQGVPLNVTCIQDRLSSCSE